MNHLAARLALMLGNFVIGLAIIGIAGMLPSLATGLDVNIPIALLAATRGSRAPA
jgi:predicted MFS family arabinose efflux permease